MYPATNRTIFIDPVQDATVEAERILVLRQPDQYTSLVDTIVDVGKTRYHDGTHAWYVTTDGHYVHGAPLNPSVRTGYSGIAAPVVGIISDDLFVVGTLSQLLTGGEARITNAVRSDRLGEPSEVITPMWVKAAPWASRLIPLPTDGMEVVAAKLAVAVQLHQSRKAHAGILIEAITRGYENDIADLIEEGALPKPILGAQVKGSAFLPVNIRLGEEALEQARTATAKMPGTVISGYGYAMVDLTFMYPEDAATKDDLESAEINRALTRHAATAIGYNNLVLGNITLAPVLRNLI
jgi:hypothetical protein